MFQNEQHLFDLARTDRNAVQAMHEQIRRYIARLCGESQNKLDLIKPERLFAKAAKATNKQIAKAAKAANTATQAQKSPADGSGVQRSLPSGAQYMMQTSDARFQQEYETKVDEVLNGQYKGVVLVGRTPQSLIDIGFNQLPLTITSDHIYTIAKTQAQAMNDPYYIKGANYHGLGDQAVKEIRKQLENPIMILQHQEFTQRQKDKGLSSKRVAVVVQLNVGGKQVICPIEVDGNTQKDGRVIDANVITTYFDKGSFGQLLQEAIAKDNIGETGFFYLDKKRSEPVLKAEGHQLPPRLLKESSDHGIIIRDISEKINRKISHFTQSQQFIRWFGDWRAYDRLPTKVVSFEYGETPKINNKSREVRCADFKRSIIVDNTVVEDSLHYAKQNGDEKQIRKLLRKVDDILRNAVYLDTKLSDNNKGNKKGSTQYMHYLYTPVSINGAPFMAKLCVEEYDVLGKTRAYNLRRIEMPKLSRAQ